MKKTIIYSCLLAVSAILISCGTTKEVQSTPDSYVAEGETLPAIEENADVAAEPQQAKKAKKKKNAIEDFFTFGNKDDYIIYDNTTVFAKEITGMKEKNAKMAIRYDNYMAGFGSYNSGLFYFVQFDKENRQILAKAIESYLSDFENKRLQRKGKHTERAYGKINYRIDWGTISSSTPNNGQGEGYCGYEFHKGSPYFVISNYPFENNYYERSGGAANRESASLQYYFTRSQLKQLTDLLAEDVITKHIAENDYEFAAGPATIDEY